MTAIAGIRSICVVALVTGEAIIGNGSMSSSQRVNRAVVKSRGTPGSLRMTGFAGGGELRGNMIRIRGLIVLCHMTTIADICSVVVISFVAAVTVISNLHMGSLQDKIIVVNGECGRLPVRQGSMAGRTFRWNAERIVIGIGRLIKIRCMAIITNRGSSGKSGNMTLAAFDGRMSAGQGKS